MNSTIKYIKKEYIEKNNDKWEDEDLQLLYNLIKFIRNGLVYNDKNYSNSDIWHLSEAYLNEIRK